MKFDVLSDPGNAFTRELGLVFQFPDDLKEVYGAFPLSLPEFNGDDSWELPMPARIIISADGVIRSIDVDPDYTVRPEASATVEELRKLI